VASCSDKECQAAQTDSAARLSVVYQLQSLLTYPFVKELVDQQKLFLHGWYYVIETGEVEYYDLKDNKFYPLSHVLNN